MLAGLKPKLTAAAGRVAGDDRGARRVARPYAGSALESVADNISQATARLDVARTEIEEAGTELAADKRAAAAVSARAAEEAIEQAGTLLDGIRRLADELAQAANRLVEARAEIEADLAEARLLPGAGLAAAVARAEAALTSAGRAIRGGGQLPHLVQLRIALGGSRDQYRRVIGQLEAAGVGGIIYGCTEIDLLVGPHDASVPVFDSTRIHVEAAVEWALAVPADVALSPSPAPDGR